MLAWTMWSFVLLLSENDMLLVSGFALIPSSSSSTSLSSSSLSSHLHLLPTMTPRSGRGSGGLGLVPTITTPSITRRGIPTTAATTATRRTSTTLWAIRCEDKYYQLEEMEDAENCTTELFLKKDGTVEIGKTDGPVWIMAQGSWHIIQGTDKFVMTIVKTFQTGSTTRDMGEFEFDVIRTYQGDMIYVGESVAITGIMKHNKMATNNKFNNNKFNNNNIREDDEEEEDNEETVGFFNMIDGTDIRLDRRDDARPSSDVDVTKVELKNDATATHRGAEGMDLSLSTTIASSSSTTRSTSSTSTSSINGGSRPISFGGGSSGSSGGSGPAQDAQQQQQPWQQQPSWQTGQQQQQQQPWQQPWQTWQRQEQQQQPAQVPVQQQQQQQQQQPWQQQPWQQQPWQQQQQQPTVVAQQEQQQEEMTRTMTNQKTSMDLPEGWEQHYDGGQQSYYYFNKATGLSQWERPQQPFDGVTVAVVDSQSSSSSLSLGVQEQDQQQEQATTTTTYTKPNPLAAGWEQYYDTNQQAYYYHNQATGLSQWEKPS